MLLQQLFNIVLFPWPSFGALCIDGNCEEFMQCEGQSGLLEAGGYTCVLTRGLTEELECPNHFFLLAVYSQVTGAWTRSCHTEDKDNNEEYEDNDDNENNEVTVRTIFLNESLTTGANVTFHCVPNINALECEFSLGNSDVASIDITVNLEEVPSYITYGSDEGGGAYIIHEAEAGPNLANREFKLDVLFGEGAFKVFVDGIKLFTHKVPSHLLPLAVTELTVEGGVQLKTIHIQ